MALKTAVETPTGLHLSMRASTLAVAFTLLALVGCDRVVSNSELQADASYKRTISFSHQGSLVPGSDDPKITDLVKFAGDGWTTKTSSKEGAETLTATRTVQASATAKPELSLNGKGVTYVEGTVTSEKRADGDIDYTETYKWVGPVKDKEKTDAREGKQRADHIAQIKALAPNLTDAQVATFVSDLDSYLEKLLLGPSRPLLVSLMAQPELSAKILRIRIFEFAKKSLSEKYGMSDADATRIARKFAQEGSTTPPADVPSTSSGDPSKSSDDPAMTLIQSEIKFPGTVVSTDGEVDPVDGTVFWAFYAAAATNRTVVLHARIHP